MAKLRTCSVPPQGPSSSSGGSRRNRRRRPGPATPAAGSPRQEGERGEPTPEQVEPFHLQGIESLERLREGVEQAAAELHRLRAENTALSARLRAAEALAGAAPPSGPLSPDQDPEVLRRKIDGFIEAIDRYLEQENEQEG